MLYAIVAVALLIVDQWLKYWTTLHLAVGTGTQPLIPGVVQLTHIHNYGAAFGIFKNARWFFVALTLVFAVLIVVLLARRVIGGGFGRWMAVLVLAGALGNGLDRAVYGYVVDMFQLQFMKFPIFNLADIFIDVGAILFCVYILLGGDLSRKGKRRADEPAPVHTAQSKEPIDPFDAAMLRSEQAQRKAQPILTDDARAKAAAKQPAAPAAHAAPARRPGEKAPITPVRPSVTPIRTAAHPAAPVKTAPAASPLKAAPAAPRQSAPSAPSPGARRAPSADEFDLDSILAEFGDK